MAKTLPEYATRLTGSKDKPNLQRSQVDSGQTSYEGNLQFRFFDEWHANASTPTVPNTSQIVYKFNTTYPINITARVLEIWSGGRTYRVYPANNNVTFNDALLIDQPRVYAVNSYLNEYITTHPVSGVTVGRYIGTPAFTSTDEPRNGTVVIAPSGNKQQSVTYSQSGERAGLAAGVSFYLVLDQVDTINTDTECMFRLQWEERQED